MVFSTELGKPVLKVFEVQKRIKKPVKYVRWSVL